MPDSPEYRMYLESCFTALREFISTKLEVIDTKLEVIETQTTRTNGRVTQLERDVTRHAENLSDAKDWAHHIVDTRVTDCPNVKRFDELHKEIKRIDKDIMAIKNEKADDIDEIKDGLLEYNFFKKYPKAIIIILCVYVVVAILTVFTAFNSLHNTETNTEMFEIINKIEGDIK